MLTKNMSTKTTLFTQTNFKNCLSTWNMNVTVTTKCVEENYCITSPEKIILRPI